MSTTSEERREVARKIREYVDAYGDKIEDAEMVLLGTVWCRGEFNEVVRPTSEAELLAMVADLIDPVCRVVTSGERRGKPIGSACSVCHAPLYPSTAWAHGMRYCPQCGNRVVDDGD